VNRGLKLLNLLALALSLGVIPVALAAESSITIRGRAQALVTTAKITISDLAEVASSQVEDDEAVIAIKKITLGSSPRAGMRETYRADQVLQALRAAGVDMDRIKYALPQEIAITRAGRGLSEGEVRQAIDEAIARSGREITVRSISYPLETQVPTGDISVTATEYNLGSNGRVGFSLAISQPGEEVQQVMASASVDEWISVPLARRAIPRGQMVSEQDVVMARANLASFPRDAATELAKILGLQTNREIGHGQSFKNGDLQMPALVSAGSPVSMVYRRGLLEATAKGTAIESGSLRQIIKVRNDSSKKIVLGTVLESGVVEVTP
jgi:flagellar basal body P-ring formation protein FlgA